MKLSSLEKSQHQVFDPALQFSFKVTSVGTSTVVCLSMLSSKGQSKMIL